MKRTQPHPARKFTALASYALALSALLVLSGCAGGGIGSLPSLDSEGRALRAAKDGEYSQAASIYIGLAGDASGSERDRLTLLAVEQWLHAGDIRRATTAFDSVTKPSAGENYWLWSANKAAFELKRQDPDAALAIIEPLSREALPQSARLRIEGLRADAWFMKGDPARATGLLVQRQSWLSDEREREQNEDRLWRGLLGSNAQDLRSAADAASNSEVRGWLTLGALATSTGQQGMGWSNGVQSWRKVYPRHPANTILDSLDIPGGSELDYPRQLALLLPLSGSAASAGQAIQNGFFGAYFASAGGLDDRQTVRVYDVNAEGGASAAYATAVADGAEFVVGPLLRQNVAELANDILVPVPVLTLNYLADSTLAPPGLYQFSLAPEDEAAAVAQRAIADGHQYALALIPDNNFGRRLFASFASQFEALGGTVLDSRSYATGTPDFSNAIEDLMSLTGSVKRYQRLRANIGGPLQFDPRRRQDADFIFLAADAPAGRLISAQLKFHYSGDLPVYATSSIYALDGRSDNDLNGVRFADAPWLIDPQQWISELPATFDKYWPEQRRLARLHAMGYDAYHLAGLLFAPHGATIREFNGATGRLYLNPDGRIHRYLAWAEFKRGKPVALPDGAALAGQSDQESSRSNGDTDAGMRPDSWNEAQQEL
ncbi:MAG TPA: penicillin-binding protein activator [Woeseiaceae bacterium]|nr:penicillin-binding protein activator [Woeseiaceae bacterium]